jgi:putative restriction endonuclease
VGTSFARSSSASTKLISRRLLDDEDGPMLDVLKRCHGTTIEEPAKRLWRPDPERLAVRFERFRNAA